MRFRNLLVLALYTLLALALTYPLVTQFGDHVPGTAQWSLDEYGYVWNHWWFKYALFERGTNPFYTNYLFYPLGTNLILYAYTLLHVALALPLQFVFGLIPAVNTTIIFSFVLSAYGMYLFARYLLRVSFRIWKEKGFVNADADLFIVELSAFVAGVAFAFTSNKFVYVSLGHYNVIATEWIPFYLLFLVKTLLQREWKFPLLTGLFAAFALYSETTDGVLLALLTLIVLVFEWRLLNRATLARIGVMGLSAGVFFAPLLIPTVNEIFFSGYTLPGWGHAENLLVDLNGFFTPTSLNPFTRDWEHELDLVRQGVSRFSDVNTFFVGYVTALLAFIGAARYFRTVKMWIAIALAFAILSLGPLLHINGVSQFDLDGLSVTFPMPFLALHYIPILRENRVPNRYSLLVVLALAVLIAYAAYWLTEKIKGIKFIKNEFLLLPFTFLLLACIIVEHLAVPLPLTDARIPDLYSQIAREPGDFAVLSLPLGWRNSFGQTGAEDTRTQYYQSAAQKFLFTGQIQRNPDSLFDYFANLPVFKSLIALETYNAVSDEQRAADKKIAPALASFFDIRYVVVNAAVPNRPPYDDNRASVLDYLQQVFPLGEKIYGRDGVIAWRVNQPALPDALQIDFGTAAAQMSRADGWSADENVQGASANWVTNKSARFFFPTRDTNARTLTIRALPFSYPNAPAQRVNIVVNGHALQTLTLDDGWKEYRVTLPSAALIAGLNQVELQPSSLVRPRDVLPTHFDIGATGITSPVDIRAQSTRAFASLKINGREVSPLKRGYNLAVLDPKTGAVLDVKNFDTGGSIVESRALTDFISKLPDGVIVAGATQEDAGTNLGDRAVAALKLLGLKIDLRANPDHTHAFVGVKGAASGNAAEASSADDSIITIGHAADDRTLSFAVDWIRIEK